MVSPQNPSLSDASWDQKDFISRVYKKEHLGIYEGIVEDNRDPSGLRRLRVRVPLVHPSHDIWPTQRLHWATRSSMSGGGFDYGESLVIPVGSSVWVMFQSGNVAMPVVLGAHHKNPASVQSYGQFRETDLDVPPEKLSDGQWKGKEAQIRRTDHPDPSDPAPLVRGQSEIPAEARRQAFLVPTVSVPFKSWKGASFAVEDRDAREWMEILDRSGQGLRFESRMRKDKNKHNATQRGLRSVFRGTQYNYKQDTDNRESSFSLRDLGQQGILSEARKHDERVKLASRDANYGDKSAIDFDLGGNVHTVELAAGQKRTTIHGKKAGRTMFKLTFDSQSGNLIFEAAQDITFSGKSVTFALENAYINGNLTVNGDLHVAGSESVVGDVVHATIEEDPFSE